MNQSNAQTQKLCVDRIYIKITRKCPMISLMLKIVFMSIFAYLSAKQFIIKTRIYGINWKIWFAFNITIFVYLIIDILRLLYFYR